jgi:hypothetical protein
MLRLNPAATAPGTPEKTGGARKFVSTKSIRSVSQRFRKTISPAYVPSKVWV